MLRKLRRHWERFGRQDPFWAALTWKEKSDGRWSAEEFFRNGEVVVGNLLNRAAELGLEIPRERALDFGCGPGRLTQALAGRFGVVDGVDIARSMIANARRFNRHGDRCRYHVNGSADLRRFDDATFTFVCSLLVLQHMKPEFARRYVREFMRILAPGGVLVFQAPSFDAESGMSAGSARQRVPRWPLEPSACRARIRPASDRLTGPAGQLVSLRVDVENAGNQTWPCLGQSDGGLRVWLGGHLAFPEDEHYWRHDAMRSALSRDLDPGQRITFEAWLTLPEENGDYLLELDMVQEHVCWFRQRGSETAVVRCRVEGGRERAPQGGQVPRVRRAEPAAAPLPAPQNLASRLARARERVRFAGRRILSRLASREAVMEMHGLARSDVEALVTEAGCRLIEVDRQVQAHGYPDCHFWIARQPVVKPRVAPRAARRPPDKA